MKIVSTLMDIFDGQAKRLTLSHLRAMSERQVVEYGFSPEILRKGVKAWPWRELPEDFATHTANQIPGHSTIFDETEVKVKSSERDVIAHRYAA
ncbi:hypothetical protein [Granulosicoccus antarcticus]|uniref:Uncharacterized protein n=1 Tax=Granulosicoccus antarcticus IMCC3135 TaxID=1192854 RepID=A0A2Z2NSV0_9GAMM|nr:hypothetical protein [Granulosicoccus antarcticus]ASJ73101.1 hypothetical protein IMCC3135_15085 [Granulosicoccus antarcticus IMCC3135]